MLQDDFYKEIQHELELSYKDKLENNTYRKQIDIPLFKCFVQQVKEVILPEYYPALDSKSISMEEKIRRLHGTLVQLLEYEHENAAKHQEDAILLMKKLPGLRKYALLDIKAAYEKDPAATSYYMVAASYPGIYAIINHRISHELYLMGYPIVARMVSELTHGKTGIDIHPGAKIGESFFIDHGTGVVVGETTEIGNGVTLYQGVTLGAFSFRKDEAGNIVKGNKRHPTIQDNVTIYSGATILGGDTVVGAHSIVGGNVWLTKSIPAYSKVTAQPTISIVT
ncbi:MULTISPECIES: serine O-acetyltransferase EpsC [Aneurinibacillus]|jgi:serine O-acetyltransferase|uniref:Uncharacterized protein n=1 Tax=Aneurinibacillus danicus TaxID=267746 RepID=A0A511V9A0_9BACL|nr:MULTISPECIES: serine O-acetyltransferase EpsC [Aneurinibacillus]GEN35515.1 hypothetical protein ADA01nite_29750 [Aneurinibacillus danicus]